jgi:hypothetical protein
MHTCIALRLSAAAPTAALGQEIGQASSAFSATLSTVRMEAKTWVQRVPVSVLVTEGAAAPEGASAEGEGVADGSVRPNNFKKRSLFRAGLDMADCDQDECTMSERRQ